MSRDRYAFLVAAIRGNPPESLRVLFQDTLARIHAEKRHALETFDGDTAAFLDVRDLLANCLRVQEKPREHRTSPFLWLIVLLPLAMLLLGAYWLYGWHQDNRQWARYVQRLQAEPGIVVTGAEKRDGAWHVAGLRDPLAVDPKDLLPASKLDPARVVGHWEPFQGFHPAFVLRRVQASLDPLPSVSLTLENDEIRARGRAPHEWIEKARWVASLLPPGAAQLNLTLVEDIDKTALQALRDSIQSRLIYFDRDAPTPTPGQETVIAELARELRELADLSRKLRLAARVTVIGHADSTGRPTFNLGLSVGRAEVVRSLLRTQGVDPDLLSVRGAGPLEPVQARESSDDDRYMNRRVSFTVGLGE